jgi:hypothetical protein
MGLSLYVTSLLRVLKGSPDRVAETVPDELLRSIPTPRTSKGNPPLRGERVAIRTSVELHRNRHQGRHFSRQYLKKSTDVPLCLA